MTDEVDPTEALRALYNAMVGLTQHVAMQGVAMTELMQKVFWLYNFAELTTREETKEAILDFLTRYPLVRVVAITDEDDASVVEEVDWTNITPEDFINGN